VLADEIASTEVELVRRLKDHPGYQQLLTLKGRRPDPGCRLRRRDRRRVPVPDRGRMVVLGRDHPAPLRVGQDRAPRAHQHGRLHPGALGAVEAVQRNCEPAIKDVREQIIARRGKDARNTAKVAAGRVILEAVYHLLRDGECRRLAHHTAA
jgi:hypothetical protein